MGTIRTTEWSFTRVSQHVALQVLLAVHTWDEAATHWALNPHALLTPRQGHTPPLQGGNPTLRPREEENTTINFFTNCFTIIYVQYKNTSLFYTGHTGKQTSPSYDTVLRILLETLVNEIQSVCIYKYIYIYPKKYKRPRRKEPN